MNSANLEVYASQPEDSDELLLTQVNQMGPSAEQVAILDLLRDVKNGQGILRITFRNFEYRGAL